ncbi:MAG: hypothetical protein WAM63_12205 [Rhodomicrobium sp.]
MKARDHINPIAHDTEKQVAWEPAQFGSPDIGPGKPKLSGMAQDAGQLVVEFFAKGGRERRAFAAAVSTSLRAINRRAVSHGQSYPAGGHDAEAARSGPHR